MVVASCILRRI